MIKINLVTSLEGKFEFTHPMDTRRDDKLELCSIELAVEMVIDTVSIAQARIRHDTPRPCPYYAMGKVSLSTLGHPGNGFLRPATTVSIFF